MNTTYWNAFPEMSIIQREMNRMFDGALNGGRSAEPSTTAAWAPAADIYETPNELMLQVDLPGLHAGNIEVTVENNVLTIRGERQFDLNVQPENLHRVERPYGKFSRSFTLPAAIDNRNIQATHKNGVLTLTLPKAAQARPRRIEVAASAVA